MWLIIAEDSVCAERTPPWGCGSLDEYAGRLARGLDAIDRHPELHITFDFSAVELDDMARRCPEMVQRIRDMVSNGQVSFVNGTWSQPHLQMHSIESAIRQFRHGIKSIEDITGCRVRCYAAQEPGITPYVPQILHAMGYVSASTPDFPFGLVLTGGRIQHWDKHWEYLAGDDMVDWTSPDGSVIPLWLKSCGCPDEAAAADECQHGLLGRSRLRVDQPDMVEVTAEWMDARTRNSSFVLLDRALEMAAADNIPHGISRATACLDANYAYCEGVDAGELLRQTWSAESELLTLEALLTLLPEPEQFDSAAAWRLVLTSQHHDAHWTGAPELRTKATGWLRDLREELTRRTAGAVDEIARGLSAGQVGSSRALVVGVYPTRHRIPARVDLPDGALVDEQNRELPVQDGVFVADCDGLGYRTYQMRQAEKCKPEPMPGEFRYANNYYSSVVGPDSMLASLNVTGGDILAGGGNNWLYRDDDRDVLPELRSSRLTRGPVFDRVQSELALGPVRINMELYFYHELPWFEVRAELVFDSPAEIGDYFDDRTKLHFAWPLAQPGVIRHAVGGWPQQARAGKSFIASPWVDAGGQAICLFSTGKCWVDEDAVLRVVVGWGHNGDHFHNRQGPLRDIMGPLNWAKPMDLRLSGAYTVRCAVWPHGGSAGEADIAGWSASMMMPPVARVVPPGMGDAPASKTALSVREPGIVPLSVQLNGPGEATVRLVELAGEKHSLGRAFSGDWRPGPARLLDGSPAREIGPYKIFEADFKV